MGLPATMLQVLQMSLAALRVQKYKAPLTGNIIENVWLRSSLRSSVQNAQKENMAHWGVNLAPLISRYAVQGTGQL